jgi:hypothetical protein
MLGLVGQGTILAGVASRMAGLGPAATDDDESRAQKATLTIATASITGLAVIWVGT